MGPTDSHPSAIFNGKRTAPEPSAPLLLVVFPQQAGQQRTCGQGEGRGSTPRRLKTGIEVR